MDKSMRSYDKNGHLIVERTVITKAAVNQYVGKEIPNCKELGLDPEKIYHLLRDPKELEKALSSFKGVQLLIKHTPVSADEPHNNLTVGSVGTDIEMDGNDVYASLRVFDKYAIDLIESSKLQELSAGYAYTADMTAGEFNGQGYDGVMRNIHGNHVALVERGRIGRDAIISDSLPIEIMEKTMKLKKGAIAAITAKLEPIIAMDGDITPDIVDFHISITRLVACQYAYAHTEVNVSSTVVYFAVHQNHTVVECVFKIKVGIIAAFFQSGSHHFLQVSLRHTEVNHCRSYGRLIICSS